MATDDSLTRSRPLSPSEIIRGLREIPTGRTTMPEPDAAPESATTADVGDFDSLDALPKASDEYAAFGRAGNKPLTTLYFMLKDGSWDGFAYANLERIRLTPASEAGGGNELVLRFAGSSATEVRLKGRNLAKLYNYLGQHRTPWVRELPSERDFQATSAAVVTAVAIEDV